MVAYSFKLRFVQPIIDGRKRQTIRATGKRRHAGPGDELQLYTGQRTRACQLIGTAICMSAWPITIDIKRWLIVAHDRDLQTPEKLDYFATQDGFPDAKAMREFWQAEHGDEVFHGFLIEWTALRLSDWSRSILSDPPAASPGKSHPAATTLRA